MQPGATMRWKETYLGTWPAAAMGRSDPRRKNREHNAEHRRARGSGGLVKDEVGWVGLDWIRLDWVGLTELVARSAVQVQAIPHSPARPNVVASHLERAGASDHDLDDPMQPCQNQVVRWALGVGMDTAIGTRTCVCTHAHAPVCVRLGRDEEKAEH